MFTGSADLATTKKQSTPDAHKIKNTLNSQGYARCIRQQRRQSITSRLGRSKCLLVMQTLSAMRGALLRQDAK
jgi:hypothetical protein